MEMVAAARLIFCEEFTSKHFNHFIHHLDRSHATPRGRRHRPRRVPASPSHGIIEFYSINGHGDGDVVLTSPCRWGPIIFRALQLLNNSIGNQRDSCNGSLYEIWGTFLKVISTSCVAAEKRPSASALRRVRSQGKWQGASGTGKGDLVSGVFLPPIGLLLSLSGLLPITSGSSMKEALGNWERTLSWDLSN